MFSDAYLLVQDEMQNIDDLFAEYELLFSLVNQREPDNVEILALAALTHSFYNGLENIFTIIAKRIDAYTPTSASWHTDLLLSMGNETETRKAVLQITTIQDLHDYLGFRHFFRHSYTNRIEWAKLQPLITNMHKTWISTKRDLDVFIKTKAE